MRSVSKGATLKHNPRTETRDKSRGRPSIINHVGHYLSLSLSLPLSHSHTSTYSTTKTGTHTHTHTHTHTPRSFTKKWMHCQTKAESPESIHFLSATKTHGHTHTHTTVCLTHTHSYKVSSYSVDTFMGGKKEGEKSL